MLQNMPLPIYFSKLFIRLKGCFRLQIFKWLSFSVQILIEMFPVKPHSSVGNVTDLRTGGRWFDPRLGQYCFRGLNAVYNSI